MVLEKNINGSVKRELKCIEEKLKIIHSLFQIVFIEDGQMTRPSLRINRLEINTDSYFGKATN